MFAVSHCSKIAMRRIWDLERGRDIRYINRCTMKKTRVLTSVIDSCSSNPLNTFFLCVSVLTPCPLYFSMLFFVSAIISSNRSISLLLCAYRVGGRGAHPSATWDEQTERLGPTPLFVGVQTCIHVGEGVESTCCSRDRFSETWNHCRSRLLRKPGYIDIVQK